MYRLALRNVWQHRVRSLLTILGVAVAVQLYLSMTSMIASAESDLERQLDTLAGKLFVQRPMTDESMLEEFPSPSSSISLEVADELLAIDGLDESASSAILYLPLAKPPAPGSPPPTCAVGIEAGHESAFLGPLQLEAGQGTLPDADSVVLGQGAAEYYGGDSGEPVQVGQSIQVLGRSFRVVGVLQRAPAVHNGIVMMDLPVAQELFGRPNSVSAVILSATSIEDVGRVKSQVESLHPELNAATQEDVEENVLEVYATVYSLADMVNTVAVVVVILFVMIVMIIAVMERRKDIGVLRAIGARRWTIFVLIAVESLALSLAGAVLAAPLWMLIRVFVEVGIVSAAEVVLSNWIRIGLLAVLAGVGASLLPAWRAVQVDPLEALRYE